MIFFSFPVNDSYLTRVHSVRDCIQKKNRLDCQWRNKGHVFKSNNIHWNISANEWLHGFLFPLDYFDFFLPSVHFVEVCKGQLTSKRNFGILEFFQKTNKRIRHSSVRQKK